MTTQDSNYVKILFRFHSDVLDEETVETMWATIVDKDKGLYKIDNIPFYVSIASGDIVFAERDEDEEMLTYRYTVEYSGNSLIQVIIMDKSAVTNDIRDIFNTMDSRSEKFEEGYFVIEVLADKDYKPIKLMLSELQDKGIIDYAEPVISENHQY
jgi:hypothetical protein